MRNESRKNKRFSIDRRMEDATDLYQLSRRSIRCDDPNRRKYRNSDFSHSSSQRPTHTHLQHRLSKMFGPLNLSLAPQVKKSRTLYRWIKPLANWYAQLAGYRQMGLKYDDLCKCLILRPLFFCKKVYLFLS